MKTQLDSTTITFASKQSLDKNGRVFFWNNDVYRAITLAAEPVYQQILESPHLQRLYDIGLVETEVTPLELEGYGMVLKHRKVPFVSYVSEWCGSMLKDAALMTLDLALALDEMGFTLQDAHPWNVLFDASHPVFTDFTSIIPSQVADRWLPFREFIGTFYLPLVLMAEGCPNQARDLLVDVDTLRGRRVTRRDVLTTLLKKRKLMPAMRALISGIPTETAGRKQVLERLRERVALLQIPLEKTAWSNYYVEGLDLSTQADWITKRKSALEAISRCRPTTLLDIGSNSGWFSKLAAVHGSRVIATDRDETCINTLYQDQAARKMDILPLSMDFRHPTPAYGIELRCAPATERLKCEMVLALAIVHHLVFSQKLSFQTIVSNIAAFTDKWLLIEFIPREDKYVREWYNDTFDWYTTEAFVEELRKHFQTVETLPSNPEPRLMFLCQR